jgi:choline dehydrogenase
VRKAEVSPTKLGESDVRKFIVDNLATFWHPVGSCRLGNGPDDVVDQECRVHGARNLRVADASIMPRITTTNTNAPSMMIGQKAADIILKTSKANVGAAKR